MATNRFYTSSPTIVLPPNPPEQYFGNHHYAGSSGPDTLMDTLTSSAFPPAVGSSTVTIPGCSLAGRKRSRGDINSPEDELEQTIGEGSKQVLPPSPPKSSGPFIGSGMTSQYPENPAYQFVAETKSATQAEEATALNESEQSQLQRPSVTSRKSQRRDFHAKGSDDLAQLVLPSSIREITAEPLIDEATRALGISWTRMDQTEALLINRAAYGKYIQHHYPSLDDVTVWFENSALPGYLVNARNKYTGLQEFYIFSNDLTEARLVTSEPSQLLPRLQMLPALHLAAPGGCLHAETDPITASQNAVDSELEAGAKAGDASEATGVCAAHAMEMD
ncbi:hypothetical protein K431DRAFT_284619 [Polychaeton citri CBS 116435]|uniref:Uncharacterized protein n=1 Tax=Polychaeton citri CBS 116435 TaxID=1314669 RepID=A0A9P4UMW0_9PEZI|nr:hypothetical protein K431DRAFT_284619 [Polychaeton citri CBS 116435]